MANIIDIYKGSEFAKIGKNNLDKTPISADNKSKIVAIILFLLYYINMIKYQNEPKN